MLQQEAAGVWEERVGDGTLFECDVADEGHDAAPPEGRQLFGARGH